MNQERQLEYTPLWEYSAPPLRIGIRGIFKVLLYCAGIFLAVCSLLGISFTIFGPTAKINWVTMFLACGTLGGSLVIFFRTRYKARCLSWIQYLWWILGATIGAIMLFILEAAFVPDPNDKVLPTAIFGCITLLYGIALAGIAHLTPSQHQQVDESVRRILKTMPGEQISVVELIARLQKEYNLPDAALRQDIGYLPYLEQIDMPLTSTRICRMKGTKTKLVFPQVGSITTDELRQKVARALLFLNEENVDIGLFLLSKEFEATLKAYLVTANAKAKLQILVKDPPDRWKLIQMIDWVRNNGIISDYAVLNYLRQTRNDRTHGGMPSPDERHILMMGIQYLANLYIDYIKLLDDLTHEL